jgi:hypothetical protein
MAGIIKCSDCGKLCRKTNDFLSIEKKINFEDTLANKSGICKKCAKAKLLSASQDRKQSFCQDRKQSFCHICGQIYNGGNVCSKCTKGEFSPPTMK